MPREPAGRRRLCRSRMGVGLALFVLSACASMQARERMDALELSLTAYGNALRWGNIEAAAQYRVARTGAYPPIDAGPLRDLRVVSYEVVNTAVDSAQVEAVVSSVIRYYREDVGRVETMRDRQRWWYNPALRRWFLDGDLPDFGAR